MLRAHEHSSPLPQLSNGTIVAVVERPKRAWRVAWLEKKWRARLSAIGGCSCASVVGPRVSGRRPSDAGTGTALMDCAVCLVRAALALKRARRAARICALVSGPRAAEREAFEDLPRRDCLEELAPGRSGRAARFPVDELLDDDEEDDELEEEKVELDDEEDEELELR